MNDFADITGATQVGLKFYLSDSRGPYRLQALKIVGIQRLVRKAARLSKFVAK